MSDNIKMDSADLDKVRTIQTKFHNLTYQLGEVTLDEIETEKRLHKLRKKKDDVEQSIQKLKVEYQKISQDMYKKYGDMAFDLDSGQAIDLNAREGNENQSEQ